MRWPPPKNGFPNKLFIITITKKVVYYVNSAQCTIQLHLVHVVCITVFYLTIFLIGFCWGRNITGMLWRAKEEVQRGFGSHCFYRQYPWVTKGYRNSKYAGVYAKGNQDQNGELNIAIYNINSGNTNNTQFDWKLAMKTSRLVTSFLSLIRRHFQSHAD